MATKVGVIGAGNIGFGMCRNLLQAGFDLVVYDLRPDPLAELRKQGATIATGPDAVARACRVLFSVVLDYPQNLGVLTGPDGVLEHMASGGCIFVCSTLSPSQARELAARAAERDITLLDCPVSGGYEGAMAGTLSLMIGGDPKAVEEHTTILEAISANIYHLGNVGSGEAAKAVNQVLIAVHDVATAEALLLAAKSGIDLRRMAEIVSTSAGQSWMFEHRSPRMIDRDFRPRGVLRILCKDTQVVMETAENHGLILPLVTAARHLFQAGVNRGLGDEDDAAVVKVLEELAGFSLADVES